MIKCELSWRPVFIWSILIYLFSLEIGTGIDRVMSSVLLQSFFFVTKSHKKTKQMIKWSSCCQWSKNLSFAWFAPLLSKNDSYMKHKVEKGYSKK